MFDGSGALSVSDGAVSLSEGFAVDEEVRELVFEAVFVVDDSDVTRSAVTVLPDAATIISVPLMEKVVPDIVTAGPPGKRV